MSPIDTTPRSPQTNGPGAKAQDAVGQARGFGREVKDQATELTKTAAATVKTQAANLTETAKDLAADAGERLRSSVSEQKAAGADYVGNVANIIRRTAYEFDADIPTAGHYIRKAAAQLENVSDAMRNRDMSEIVGNVQDFARKQPTAFFGAAVLLGFAAVRFLKSGSGNLGGSTVTASNAGPGAPRTGMSNAGASAPRTGM